MPRADLHAAPAGHQVRGQGLPPELLRLRQVQEDPGRQEVLQAGQQHLQVRDLFLKSRLVVVVYKQYLQ